jgi:hypothetical protein
MSLCQTRYGQHRHNSWVRQLEAVTEERCCLYIAINRMWTGYSPKEKEADDPHHHQPLLFHCPVVQRSLPTCGLLQSKTKGAANKLLKHNTQTDTRVFENTCPVDSDNPALLNARKLALLFG